MRTSQNSKKSIAKSRKESSGSSKGSSAKRRASSSRPAKKKSARGSMAEQNQISPH